MVPPPPPSLPFPCHKPPHPTPRTIWTSTKAIVNHFATRFVAMLDISSAVQLILYIGGNRKPPCNIMHRILGPIRTRKTSQFCCIPPYLTAPPRWGVGTRILFKALQTPGGRGPACPFLGSGFSTGPSRLGVESSTTSPASAKIFGQWHLSHGDKH